MRLTPIEIRQHRFSMRWRGFCSDEVTAFLDTVVADFEDVVRENALLRRDVERLRRDLEAFRTRERTIQETLTTAQGVVDQLKRTAMKEAEVTVVEAELQAEKIVDEARTRRSDLTHDIQELRHLRGRLEADLRHTLEGYRSMLELYGESRETGWDAKPERGESV